MTSTGLNQPLKLSLDDAPLVLTSVYADSDMKISWPKQTTWLTPAKLPKKITEEYDEKMGWILRQYKALQMQDDLRAIAPHVLPYGAKVSLELAASQTELIASVPVLRTIPLDYSRQLSQSLSENLNSDSGRTKLSQVGTNTNSVINDRKRVKLVEASPLNELEIVRLGTYAQSGQSWADNLELADSLTYDQKEQQLLAMLGSGRQLEFGYRFELVAEPLIISELNSKRLFSSLIAQVPTPAHGYNIPKINDGGILQRCFDMSYELYSTLQSSLPASAQLACLYGHRQRYLVTLSVNELNQLYDRQAKYTTPALNVIKFMRKEISLKHQTVHKWFDDKKEKG